MTNYADTFSAISGLLYEEDSFGVFVLVTVILGGGAATLAGRAIALTWRPWWQIVVYMLHSRRRGPLLSLRSVRRHAHLAALLCRGQRDLHGVRIYRFPGRAR